MAQSIPLTVPAPGRAHRLRAAAAVFAREHGIALASFIAVVGLALALNAWRLNDNAFGNTYYAAAVRSMTLSWKNFFFGSFDPGGFITVDKPPAFLWVGALSARLFGYSSWSILLPSAFAGAASVAILWLIARRYFGLLAATVSALVLALTPISVAVDRLNLPEPFLILALVGAAAATLRSLDSRRWWAWTLGAGVLVGIAFNTKMLAAWIPGPALALALVAGDGNTWRPALRRIAARLALLAAATFLVSASWMLIVDAWPASDRPYIGGSTDNSVQNLALDYNGLGRVDGNERPGGANRGPAGQRAAATTPGGAPTGAGPIGGAIQPGGGNFTRGGTQPGGAPPANGAGGIIAGTPGLFRMFDDANAGQIAWLLPFAILGSILCAWRWRADRLRRAALVLWLGWLLLFAGVFSFAQGIYHSYYTAAMAPGVAALAGMTVVAAKESLARSRRWLLAVAVIVAVTAVVQFDIADRFPAFLPGASPYALAVLAAGAALTVAAAFALRRLPATVGLSAMAAGLLVLPGSWATYESLHPSMNTTLPQAGPREGAAGRSFGSEAFDGNVVALAAWLHAHRNPGARWDLAVSSAQNASTLIAAYNLSVMPLGGFSGSDPTITASQFADLVAAGDVRYVLVGGGQGPTAGQFQDGNTSRQRDGSGAFRPNGAPGTSRGPTANAGDATNSAGANAVMAAVQATCKQVTATDLPASYQGGMYDCAGYADALRAFRT